MPDAGWATACVTHLKFAHVDTQCLHQFPARSGKRMPLPGLPSSCNAVPDGSTTPQRTGPDGTTQDLSGLDCALELWGSA